VSKPKPIILAILDGYGIALPSKGNAISLAKKPVIDDLVRHYPHTIIEASGELVGLPWGEFGNSEVGHMNLGAGRVMYQDLPRVDKAIETGVFFDNEALQKAISQVKENNSALHLMGLVSPGGVHSHVRHLYALLELAKKEGLKNVFIHAFLDGRDMPPQAGLDTIQELEAQMKKIGVGQIASVSGRYWAMDRDQHWERMQPVYEAMVKGAGETTDSATQAIENSYQQKIFDEKLAPTVIVEKGKPVATINNQDAVIFFNYRSDRASQLTNILADPEFSGFKRNKKLEDLLLVTLTDYGVSAPVSVVFSVQEAPHSLGEVLAEQGLKQLRIAETEKFAHVTSFLNCGRPNPFVGEDRQLIPSPSVSSYAEKPAMSALEVTDKLLTVMGNYDFILLNFANPDMVAHTGDIPAATKAVEVVDQCLGKIVKKVSALGGSLLITADHGNADVMLNLQTGEMIKEHTVNPVPLILVNEDQRVAKSGDVDADLSALTPVGVLADVAPTILDLLGVKQPEEMTGMSLKNAI